MDIYADIIVPVSHDPFTFSVDERHVHLIREGIPVKVQIGVRKIYMGVVWKVHDRKPPFATKPILDVLSPDTLVSHAQMQLWEWVSSYYMCTLGDVMRFALPAALKPTGKSQEEFERDKYRPVTRKYLSLHPRIGNEDTLNEVCEGLKRAKAQYAALLEFCSLVPEGCPFGVEVSKASLTASPAIIAKLIEREILVQAERETAGEIETGLDIRGLKLPVLTAAQLAADEAAERNFDTKDCALLHGVTGSGKTEIYMHMIARQIEQGNTVLYMMPEIAMTSQIVRRVVSVFGDRVVIYHSKLSDRQRAEAYRKLAHGGGLVLGVRSSVFLPLPGLGLIIVDEEHDASYKQNEPAPRYNARDCAVWMASRYGAKCLLASATPSIESYVNATGAKYGYVKLMERYGEGRLPNVIISDSSRAFKRGERKLHFDKLLLDKISATFAAGRQVMLFQNRRGFSPWIECPECGWVAGCPRCTVSLTYHKSEGRLKCHSCGYSESMVYECPKCGNKPKAMGLGTEKAEEELQRFFPNAVIDRLDRDTATTERKFERIISDFESGRTDVLIGTQMVTKGFDFPGLSLVGILNADNLLNYPDFRSGERAYQTITQVSGRAGRADDLGEVVIQTSQPDNAVIRQASVLDYEGMVRDQLVERHPFGYPPYGKLISLSLRHRDRELLSEGADKLAAKMRVVFGERVFGPHAPVIEKVNNDNYLTILLKIENGRSFAKSKTILSGMIKEISLDTRLRSIFITANVDPQ